MTQEIYTKVKNRLYDASKAVSSLGLAGGVTLLLNELSGLNNEFLLNIGSTEGMTPAISTICGIYLISTGIAEKQYKKLQLPENTDITIEPPKDDTYTLQLTPKNKTKKTE